LPNCLVDGDAGTLRAVRPISVGEEVTVSYLDDAGLLMDISSRQKELQERYEFRCQCQRCTSVDDTRRFSCPCGGDRLPLDKPRLRCLACKETMEAAELFEAEEKAAKSLQAARSGDLEEEDEGHELMKCHRFTSKHPHHQLTFALANEFAFPDPEASHQAVLTILDLILDMPCQLAIETGRELARRLRSSGKEESAGDVLLKAASVTMLLDGKQSIEEVLEDWGEAKTRPVKVPKPAKTGDMESLLAEEETTWLQRQRKAASSTVKAKKVPLATSSSQDKQTQPQPPDAQPGKEPQKKIGLATCTMLMVPVALLSMVLLRRPWAKT